MSIATIRTATIDDMPAVHDLVRQLAIFEKEEAAFVASLDDYRDNFAKGVFEVKVAEADGRVIGMCLYYLTYSTWKGRMLYLEDFVVNEAYRSQGIGQLLFDAFLAAAKNKACTMVKWQVLDWNSEAIRFYEKNKATIEKEWWNGKIIF